MNSETVARKLVCKTVNLMSSGGGGYGAIIPADIQAVFAEIDPPPLVFTMYLAKHGAIEPEKFENMLVPWVFKRLHDKRKAKKLSVIAKDHIKAVTTTHALSEGISGYITRHKVKNEALAPHFKQIHKSTFSRRYADFVRDCIVDLEIKLNDFCVQIIERTQDD